MPEACFECTTLIEPFRGGYPGGIMIPWHPRPSGVPCPASQSPYRAAIPGQALETAQNAVKASVTLIKPSSRAFLREDSPDANIRLWLDLVEKQTGKPFNLDGDAYCIAEELGETIEAMHRDDNDQVEDGLCDTYVATYVAELLLRREVFAVSGYSARVQPWDSLSGPNICAIFAGRLASYVRKPAKRNPERAKWVLDSLVTAKAALKRDIKELGPDWNTSMGKVLDILDGRLQEGYTMNAAGSAIKSSDSKK